MRILRLSFAFAITAAVLLSACGGDGGGGDIAEDSAETTTTEADQSAAQDAVLADVEALADAAENYGQGITECADEPASSAFECARDLLDSTASEFEDAIGRARDSVASAPAGPCRTEAVALTDKAEKFETTVQAALEAFQGSEADFDSDRFDPDRLVNQSFAVQDQAGPTVIQCRR